MDIFFVRRVPFKARFAYKNDLVSGVLGNIMLGLTLPFVANIARRDLHASDMEIGILTASSLAGSLLSLFWAKFMEGRSKKPFMVVPLIISRSTLIFIFFAYGATSFVGLIAALYIIGSISGPAYSALLKEFYPDSDRARIMAYVRVWAVGVYILALALGGWLLEHVSYRYVFPVAGVFGIISALIFNRIPSNDFSGNSEISMRNFITDSLKILVDDRGFRWFCGGIFIFGIGNLLSTPIYEIYKVDKLGVGPLWQSRYTIITAALQVAGYLYWGSFIDKQTPVKTIQLTTLLWATVPLNFIFATQPWMLLPTCIIGGAVLSAMELSYFNGVLHFAPDDRVTQYQALFMTLTGIRGIIFPLIGSFLVNSGIMSMQGVFILSFIFILAGYFVLRYGMSRYGKGRYGN